MFSYGLSKYGGYGKGNINVVNGLLEFWLLQTYFNILSVTMILNLALVLPWITTSDTLLFVWGFLVADHCIAYRLFHLVYANLSRGLGFQNLFFSHLIYWFIQILCYHLYLKWARTLKSAQIEKIYGYSLHYSIFCKPKTSLKNKVNFYKKCSEPTRLSEQKEKGLT